MKKFSLTIIVIFTLIIGGLTVATLIAPDKSISENENRSLRTSVNVSGKFIVDGSTQDEIEDYLKDQVAFRDFWMMLRTDILKLFGKSEINGVYRSKDDYLIEKIVDEDISEKAVDKNISYVQDFLEFYDDSKDAKSKSVMIIPTSGYMLRDKMCSGEIFEPKDVVSAYNLVSESSNGNIALAIDLEKLELIWLDMPLYAGYCGIGSNFNFKAMIKNACMPHMSVYDYISLFGNKVNFVSDINQADYTIGFDDSFMLNAFNVRSEITPWQEK